MGQNTKVAAKQPSVNSRRWTLSELSAFAKVLADPENCFASALALKNSSNNEVFECIQKEFIAEINTDDFNDGNAEHFANGKQTN